MTLMVTIFEEDPCRFVRILKVALAAPAGMTRENESTYASGYELVESDTVIDAVSAPFSVTVPVAVPRLTIDDGEIEREVISASARYKEALCVTAFRLA